MPASGFGFRNLIDTIVDIHGQAERAKYVAIAGSTLLVYDWALNLELEIAYIWKTPWSIGRVVYHFNRVWPLIIIGSVLPSLLPSNQLIAFDLTKYT
ncbi:hypothetical protein FRC08_005066 [Ceratobasidium sp. 394]|nr:hypothetical protein FRC08_005066 [Ceratobasidium sp. 394]